MRKIVGRSRRGWADPAHLRPARQSGRLPISVAAAVFVISMPVLAVGQDARLVGPKTEGTSRVLFPTAFTRTIEKRLSVPGDLDHRWTVRESYFDHWLVLDLESSEPVDLTTGRDQGEVFPTEGRRRILDVLNGDVIEIDWSAGRFWRSSLARQRDLVRRLEHAEGRRLDPGGASRGQAPAEKSREGDTAQQLEVRQAGRPVPQALANLRVERRLLANEVNPFQVAGRRSPGVERLEPRGLSLVAGPASATEVDMSGPDRWKLEEAAFWVDDRLVFSRAAIEALEALVEPDSSMPDLLTLSPLAARARRDADGSVPLAAEASYRLPASALSPSFVTVTEVTRTLDALGETGVLLRVPREFREIAPPLEGVVARAERERRLDDGVPP